MPHRPRRIGWIFGLLVAWLGTLALALWLLRGWGGGEHDLAGELRDAKARLQAQTTQINQLEQDAATLRRSDQVSRDALDQVQKNLAERDEEIAGLRADVTFYERLVGGSAQRKGLSVHSLRFSSEADGVSHFDLTLTQTIKKAGTSRGGVTMSIEGVQDSALRAMSWAELRQQSGDAPIPFEFRYFQRLQGSVMLPEGFRPHRVKLSLRRDNGVIEQTIPWEDTQKG